MPTSRVTPGVLVKVTHEIVPQQLFPSGVVSMIGTAQKGPICKAEMVTSYREFKEKFGEEGPGFSLPKEVKNAFLNGVFQVVAIRVGSTDISSASAIVKGQKKRNDVFKITAKDAGEGGNNIKLVIMKGKEENSLRVEIFDQNNPAKPEIYDNLSLTKENPLFVESAINESSKLINVTLLAEPGNDSMPVFGEVSLSGGSLGLPKKKNYEDALEQLELENEVELVYVCDNWDPEIHAIVAAHCTNMSLSDETKPLGPRIGLGTVGPNEPVEKIVKRTENLNSDHFILVGPYGVAGAVAGLISKLDYFESPTYKTLTGLDKLERRYTPSEQMALLRAGIVPVDAVRGKGIIVIKGITTSLQQISVMRITNRAVRGVKNICDLFIGTLNNARGRLSLRERITGFFIGMEREGALVPSTDLENPKPAFLVDVYSSPEDFAQGIVRTDIAVRPVRAMDYIYANINVQAY